MNVYIKYKMEVAKVIRKSYKFRIYPSKFQVKIFENTLDLCRELYNAALQEKREAWDLNRVSISLYDQQYQLPEIKKIREDLKSVHSQVLCDVLKRCDKAYQAYFTRIKRKEKAGKPRFKGQNRFNSFCYPQHGFSLSDGKLNLSKIGKVAIRLHRNIIGKVKTLTISRDSCGKWFACFSVETFREILEPTNKCVGIDVGLETFATLSNDDKIKNPRFFREDEKRLATAQRRFQKESKGTKERLRKRRIVAKIHNRIKNRRSNFAHQESRKLVNSYDKIFFEDLNIKGMVKNHCLAKSICDAAWNQIVLLTTYKAENAGRIVGTVNPAYTSQDCSSCGHRQKISLETRLYECPKCHLLISRDLNAARNILAVGLKSLGNQSLEVPEFICGT